MENILVATLFSATVPYSFELKVPGHSQNRERICMDGRLIDSSTVGVRFVVSPLCMPGASRNSDCRFEGSQSTEGCMRANRAQNRYFEPARRVDACSCSWSSSMTEVGNCQCWEGLPARTVGTS
jgi:hypothetical protein